MGKQIRNNNNIEKTFEFWEKFELNSKLKQRKALKLKLDVIWEIWWPV